MKLMKALGKQLVTAFHNESKGLIYLVGDTCKLACDCTYIRCVCFGAGRTDGIVTFEVFL